jgi:putative phosphoribosyl transferase
MLVTVVRAVPGTFRDRQDAGRRVGVRLLALGFEPGPVVLGLPRGGVTVAAEVARALDGHLDVVVARKLAHPGQPELALGAFAEGGGEPAWDHALLQRVGVTPADLSAVVEAERVELGRRVASYRGDRPLPDVQGRVVVLVDDGVATGATARAALRALRKRGPSQLVLAVPVGSPDSLRSLEQEADYVVSLIAPAGFGAVGTWYDDFGQLSDDDVRRALAEG